MHDDGSGTLQPLTLDEALHRAALNRPWVRSRIVDGDDRRATSTDPEQPGIDVLVHMDGVRRPCADLPPETSCIRGSPQIRDPTFEDEHTGSGISDSREHVLPLAGRPSEFK